mgnify:FL=1
MKTLVSISIFAAIFALHPSLNKGNNPITDLQHLVYGNALNISTNKAINRDLLEIRWLCEDNEAPCKDLIIFKNGSQINKIPSIKGMQQLRIFYNGKLVGKMLQHKLAKNQAHDYNIRFVKDNKDTLLLKGEIVGPSPYQFTPTIIAAL